MVVEGRMGKQRQGRVGVLGNAGPRSGHCYKNREPKEGMGQIKIVKATLDVVSSGVKNVCVVCVYQQSDSINCGIQAYNRCKNYVRV